MSRTRTIPGIGTVTSVDHDPSAGTASGPTTGFEQPVVRFESP